MVVLFGRIGSGRSGCLAEPKAAGPGELPKWMAWDRVNHLRFPVPFKEFKPELTLDPLLPRIVELAHNAIDRSVKASTPLSPSHSQYKTLSC